MVWYGMVWYGMVWYGMVWYGMVWYVCMYVCIYVERERESCLCTFYVIHTFHMYYMRNIKDTSLQRSTRSPSQPWEAEGETPFKDWL